MRAEAGAHVTASWSLSKASYPQSEFSNGSKIKPLEHSHQSGQHGGNERNLKCSSIQSKLSFQERVGRSNGMS